MVNIGKQISGFLQFIWNNKEKEFLGRDGGSWAKISLFYGIFYAILGGFFVGMLAVFRATLDDTRPTYFGKASTMNIARNFETGKGGINPGLGFRPQVDPESSLIVYSASKPSDPTAASDFERVNRSLSHYLNYYYNRNITAEDKELEIEGCESKDLDDVRTLLKKMHHCPFPYEKLQSELGADSSNDPFAYLSTGPVVFLKLNRLYNWLPQAYDMSNADKLPDWLFKLKEKVKGDADKLKKLEHLVQHNVLVKCAGEYPADSDMLARYETKYISIGEDANEFDSEFGVLPFYYYPYLNQKNYQSPLVFVQFSAVKNNQLNVLTNVLCRAYAANIDSDDKLNRRGMTQFNIFVKE